MFTGIDEVDWASLGHAYGPADDVPALLRGLASDDPAEREWALDGMYGTVHHQGEVYDSTLACIPFLLELVARPDLQDRGCVVELLASIGGIDLSGDDELQELDPECEEFEGAANYAMAAAAVAAGADVFLALVGDEDREVRLAVPGALASLHDDPVRVLDLLRERLTVECDTEVRLALVEAVGRIALRYESLREETAGWLSWLSGAAQDPALRLAALAQLARCAPGRLPHDVVPTVTRLLAELRRYGPRTPGGGPCARTGAGAARPSGRPTPLRPRGIRPTPGTGPACGRRPPRWAPCTPCHRWSRPSRGTPPRRSSARCGSRPGSSGRNAVRRGRTTCSAPCTAPSTTGSMTASPWSPPSCAVPTAPSGPTRCGCAAAWSAPGAARTRGWCGSWGRSSTTRSRACGRRRRAGWRACSRWRRPPPTTWPRGWRRTRRRGSPSGRAAGPARPTRCWR
ncbi:HEAT repeat domain-containing protein [Streptomyces sudanensis]|uniref:HEAT repeat domain-containing protein n=1 Tax=Streptomyces sudanensis TaxID=436397 RepID=UPI0035562659